jgi:hypothetical protein
MLLDHEELEGSLAASLLGACDDRETEVVRAHLETCEACRELEQRLRSVIEVLPLAVPDKEPPREVRARLLEAARGGWLPRAVVVQAPPPPRRRWQLRMSVAAALALLLMLGGAVAWDLHLRLAPPVTYSMSGTGSLAAASGRVTVLTGQDLTVVAISGLPPPEPGHVYQLWLVSPSGGVRAAAVFVPDLEGKSQILVPGTLQDVATVVVTEEPGPSGSRSPTGKPELAAQVG